MGPARRRRRWAAAATRGSRKGYWWIRADAPAAVRAIRQASARTLEPDDLEGQAFRLRRVPGGVGCDERRAVMAELHGAPADLAREGPRISAELRLHREAAHAHEPRAALLLGVLACRLDATLAHLA